MNDRKVIPCTIPIEFPEEFMKENKILFAKDTLHNTINNIANVPITMNNKAVGLFTENGNAILWGNLEPEIEIIKEHKDKDYNLIIDEFEIVNVNFKL